MSDPNAPVCFGAITAHSLDAERCKACASFDACSAKVQENLTEIARVMDIDSIVEAHKRATEKVKPQPKKAAVDTGKLKTQAPAITKMMVPAVATVANTEQGIQVTVNQETESQSDVVRSIITKLLAPTGGSLQRLRSDLLAGVNPFPNDGSESFFICELLRRGPTTRQRIENAVSFAGGSGLRRAICVDALKRATLIKQEGDTIVLNGE